MDEHAAKDCCMSLVVAEKSASADVSDFCRILTYLVNVARRGHANIPQRSDHSKRLNRTCQTSTNKISSFVVGVPVKILINISRATGKQN